jgi:hypothetical protein
MRARVQAVRSGPGGRAQMMADGARREIEREREAGEIS